ncbi:signal recognition particle, SRP14 subunit [Radiomyces spectabilis]|uniref:signal recognition particle, SRP14 subunit n=1 Tax=Radiomyces spectabilis TaxID=64574 RepID=UPI0022204F3F|nr:signal recognition particle, SRP14 subunit [Radiomyces spectabilis]KAI8381555.1 signal recognition particle, SRP14 subunit [Radiomyces spectabilis]
MKELDPVTFTVELGRFYEATRGSGAVSVTMKRMTAHRLTRAKKISKMVPKSADKVLETKVDEDVQYPTLVRATYKDKKISTMVSPDDFEKFQNAYSTVIRAYMDALKKKTRTKKAKKTK